MISLVVMSRVSAAIGSIPSKNIMPFTIHTSVGIAHPVVTDLTICFSPTIHDASCDLDPQIWHRIDKDLRLYNSQQQSAWLYVALANEEELAADDLIVEDIRVGEEPPKSSSGESWESRNGGIWLLRTKFSGKIDQAVTEVDVLFGEDAVDPRPQWALMQSSLYIEAPPATPVARLSILYGRVKPKPARASLRVRKDGKFKIVQISDTHMVTGVGICKDAIDADDKDLPQSKADPLTVEFIGKILDVEKPDLVILSGDQLHHDIADSQTALFKVVAPIIERSIPFAAVFGNHDSEGSHALSRTTQMSLLQNLPHSFSEPGPEEVDGIGNFYLQILGPLPSNNPLLTLYFLDSHGQIPNRVNEPNPGYEPTKQSQIDWFAEVSQSLRKTHEEDDNDNNPSHLALVFQHIPLPEFGYRGLRIYKGLRREPTEGPRSNSGFYNTLVKERVQSLFCGHDHVNNFCALLPQKREQDGYKGPWLCHSGCTGYGGYCSYGEERFHRGARVVEFDQKMKSLRTWQRVEFAPDRVDELLLTEDGVVVDFQDCR